MQRHFLETLGWVEDCMPQRMLRSLQTWCNAQIAQNFAGLQSRRQGLVGQIEHEYDVPWATWMSIEPWIMKLVQSYADPELTPNFEGCRTRTGLQPWINFAKPGEYNPLHVHEGSLSWVLWINIPPQKRPVADSVLEGQVRNRSYFGFVWASTRNGLGLAQRALDVDSDWMGRCIVFPSCLSHHVQPASHEAGYRISMAGNVW